MAHRVRDYFFILPADEYRLLKECLPRHSIGYDALDLAISSADETRAWSANQWQARLQDIPVADHSLLLFMQAATWADDMRMKDKQRHRALWHYINWPFKPEGQPQRTNQRTRASNIL